MSGDDGGYGRRTVLKGIGGLATVGAVGGGGLAAMSLGAAGATVSITASDPDAVKNDRGDVSEVTVDPGFTVKWGGLDDAVGKIFWLLEAKVGGGDWQPIYRATPWLDLDQIGTSGSLVVPNSENGGMGPLVIADDDGRPDYESFDFSSLGGVDYDSYMDGTSMGSASEYTESGAVDIGGEVIQNNFPSSDAGYYGAASGTSPFDNPDDNGGDGTTKKTEVMLRYTIELQRPNLSQLEYRVSESGDLTMPSGYDSMTDDEKKEAMAGIVGGVEPGDIDVGNSKIIMNGEDGYYEFGSPSGIPYSGIQAHTGHVGAITEMAAFDVTAVNGGSDGGAEGTSGTGSS